jgi:hypothetical protein
MAYGASMAMLPVMLEQDRKLASSSIGQAAWRLGVSIREYRRLKPGARSLSFETWDRILQALRPDTFAKVTRTFALG